MVQGNGLLLFVSLVLTAFASTQALDSSTPCPCGYYCPDITSKIICPVGSYCPANSTEPVACEDGFLCGTTKLCNHTICPCGYTCFDSNPVSQSCAARWYCPAGSGRIPNGQKICDAGYYCPTNNLCRQLPCPPGTMSRQQQLQCQPCSAKRYCPKPATPILNPLPPPICPAGKYCPAGTSKPLKCPAGHYCYIGVSAGKKCSCGHYCPAGSRTQRTCPAGFYCPAGTSAPIKCKKGSSCPKGSCTQ
jgi:hypothetical protein